ncbi:hypothetical protein Droror1_Dr00006951 [Drosera rotundifolia]
MVGGAAGHARVIAVALRETFLAAAQSSMIFLAREAGCCMNGIGLQASARWALLHVDLDLSDFFNSNQKLQIPFCASPPPLFFSSPPRLFISSKHLLTGPLSSDLRHLHVPHPSSALATASCFSITATLPLQFPVVRLGTRWGRRRSRKPPGKGGTDVLFLVDSGALREKRKEGSGSPPGWRRRYRGIAETARTAALATDVWWLKMVDGCGGFDWWFYAQKRARDLDMKAEDDRIATMWLDVEFFVPFISLQDTDSEEEDLMISVDDGVIVCARDIDGSTRQRWHGEARLRLEKRNVAALHLDGGGATGECTGTVAATLGCAGEEARRRLCVGNYQVGTARAMAAQGARVSLCGCVC